MAMKKYFFRFGKFSIKDGSEIWFWEDRWLGSATLPEQYCPSQRCYHGQGNGDFTFKRDV
jgi:hypothetical protein